jgi:glutathione S-transferase
MVYLADRHQLTKLAPAVTDPHRGPFLSTVFNIAGDIQYELKRAFYPHRFSLRSEDNLGIQNAALTKVLSCLEVMDVRLANHGPYVLGNRFSLADFYLSFWVAYLDQEVVRKRCPAIAALYDLVRTRPSATPYLEREERFAREWWDLMTNSATPVVN